MADISFLTIFKALGGVKVGFCLLAWLASIVLLCVGVIAEDTYVYIQTFCILTAVGGNLAGMGIHAFAKNPQVK